MASRFPFSNLGLLEEPARVDWGGDRNGEAGFTVVAANGETAKKFRHMDAYSAAETFIRGQIQIEGNLYAAIRFFRKRRPDALRRFGILLRARVNDYTDPPRRRQCAPPTEFGRQFLDSRMLYSAGYFGQPDWSLDDAQFEKLDRVCRRLELKPGDRFLDVGCGWGALLIYAAERFGALATGCTPRREQATFARRAVREHFLDGRVKIEESDYRNLSSRFDKAASIGMFDFTGHRNIHEHLRKIHSLLKPRGLFLCRVAVRPARAPASPTMFLVQRNVIPAAGLVHLADLVRQAEGAGFEVLNLESLRHDYLLTCRAWVRRLQLNGENCKRVVDELTYRTWLLSLAACAVGFEDGLLDAAELTLRA